MLDTIKTPLETIPPQIQPKIRNFEHNVPNLSKYFASNSQSQKSLQTTINSAFIQSPLNYIGGKFRLLPQILPRFPRKISTLCDLFCGGGSVGINLGTKIKNNLFSKFPHAKEVILNDKQSELISILKLFQRENLEQILSEIQGLIKHFKLSNSAEFGYKFYNCDSAKGLGEFNKNGFNALKTAYNADKDPLKLFVLVVFGFNNQLRFNAKGEFNLPCGKRDFNANMQKKLREFVVALQNGDFSIENEDFRDFDLARLDTQSLVYIDPPYFLAKAGYNENGAWSENDERDLLEFMQILHAKGLKFAFSNVLFHKGKEHKILQTWLKKHPEFRTNFLNFSYKNCNYQTKRGESCEILVRNYEVENEI